MSQETLIAVVTDALRGQVQAELPAELRVSLGETAPAGEGTAGVSVHLFRVALPIVARSVPLLSGDGRRLRPEMNLQLDYLLVGRADDALRAQASLGTAMRALLQAPMQQEESIRSLLSRPELLDALLPASLSVHWKALELPLQEQAAVWAALGERMGNGMFWRADVAWQGKAET